MSTRHKKTKKLFRSTQNSVLGGVAGGLGEYFDMDPILLRLLFVATLFFGGVGIVVYVVLWLILPIDESSGILIDENVRKGTDEMKDKARKLSEDAEVFAGQSKSKKIVGVFLVFVGGLFLLNNLGFIHFFEILRFWPLMFILIGIFLLTKRE